MPIRRATVDVASEGRTNRTIPQPAQAAASTHSQRVARRHVANVDGDTTDCDTTMTIRARLEGGGSRTREKP